MVLIPFYHFRVLQTIKSELASFYHVLHVIVFFSDVLIDHGNVDDVCLFFQVKLMIVLAVPNHLWRRGIVTASLRRRQAMCLCGSSNIGVTQHQSSRLHHGLKMSDFRMRPLIIQVEGRRRTQPPSGSHLQNSLIIRKNIKH